MTAFIPSTPSLLSPCRHRFAPRSTSPPRPLLLPRAAAAAPPPPRANSSIPPQISIEHQNVPEAHRGLHDTLYPSSAEDEHGSSSSSTLSGTASFAFFQDTVGVNAQPVSSFLSVADNHSSKIAAVYGVLDASGVLQYVGVSRNVALNLRSHLAEFGPDTVTSVRMRTFSFPRRAEMEAVRDAWVSDADSAGASPPGNTHASSSRRWASSLSTQSPTSGIGTNPNAPMRGMTPAEQAAFEEKKFKLRKAMADPSLIDELEAADRALAAEADLAQGRATVGGSTNETSHTVSDTHHRRQNLQAAVEQDDWSGEIDAQTAATVDIPAANGPALEPNSPLVGQPDVDSDGVVVSPFAGVSASGTTTPKNNTSESGRTLSVEAVDAVLEEVRPYLVSDGGNISVLSVTPCDEDPAAGAAIKLQLEGACGTCPSSTMTMQLGVERVLRENFGNAVGEIVAVNDPAAALKTQMSVEACDAILDEVRPILSGLGNCSVQTKTVTDGNIVLQYNGPLSLSYAMEHLLKEKLPGIKSIKIDGVF